MDNASGEDLSWWWRGWYFNNGTLDLAVTSITATPGGSLVSLEAIDPLIMPATLRVALADGSQRDLHLPAETWIRTKVGQVYVAGPAVTSATIDPDHVIPDHDRRNNTRIASKP